MCYSITMNDNYKILSIVLLAVLVLGTVTYQNVLAQNIPEWIKNTALWYGQGNISETEFLNAIKFLIENEVIVIESPESVKSESSNKAMTSEIIIPNGNANIEHTGFYIPLNLETSPGTTVVWINDDTVLHTVQSIDEQGNIIGLFNSAALATGERFAYSFDEEGTFHYYCSLHPWRVGQVTVR